MTVSTPALEAYSLTKTRGTTSKETYVWRSPDIAVQNGQYVCVLGDRPDDVHLLLGMLAGLIEPSGGVLRIDGQAAEDLPRQALARLRASKLGLLFRQPQLLPNQTALDNVILPQRIAGVSPGDARRRALQLMERLGIEDLESRLPNDLDPLQGQLVSLARALANHPTVILAHEPTAALSPAQSEQFLDLWEAVCQEEGVAILLGTTQLASAKRAGRVFHLRAAREDTMPFQPEDAVVNELYAELYDTEVSPLLRPLGPLRDYVLKPLLYVGVVALLIVFLTFFGLAMAQAGRAGANVDAGRVLSLSIEQSLSFLGNIITGDLGTYENRAGFYYWTAAERPITEAIGRTLGKSVGLLLVSMLLGGAVGVPLGLIGALLRHRRFSLVFVALSILGVSTPSFFLALVLQIMEISAYRRTGIALLPVGGFGWDRHIVLPALVLAARPIAQVARVAFVSLSEVLDADYIRTARAKGLVARQVLSRHALRNAAVPILAAMGSSLGFSLSSLPIVEVIFQWPGMGSLLLDAIRTQQVQLSAALALLLGIFFVVVHVALDFVYRWVDPRMRDEKRGLSAGRSWVDLLTRGLSGLRGLPSRMQSMLPWSSEGKADTLEPLPLKRQLESSDDQHRRDAKIRHERRRAWVQSTAGSLPFVVGGLILLAVIGAIALGQSAAPHSAFTVHPSLEIDGQLQYAPYAPSETFLLGSDPQGRDILSLLLYGARRTMSLAFFAVVARLLLGTVLGALAGWFSDTLLDRVLMGLTQVVAAFPSLLMAMVLIYAFGIRQGLWVFALALCLIGWGEAAQFVRSKVMYIREQDYVEGALAVGLGDLQLLSRHVLPNLVPSLVVLAFLEMGGVLMILGELGFIGVFIGGGTRTISAADSLITYFDVPEWGVMLSNTWRSFRSYPWMTFYPALAFTVSIVGFNLFGEGLRRLTERLTLSMHRIINRYTLGATLAVGVLLLMAVEGTGSWAQFAPATAHFDTARAMEHVRQLTAPALEGRRLETPGLELAAQYIASQFEALGLQPAGPEVNGALTYFVPVPYEYEHLNEVPTFELFDSSGQPLTTLEYRRDYAEVPDSANNVEPFLAEVVCVGMSLHTPSWPASWPANFDYEAPQLLDKVLMLPSGYFPAPLQSMSLRAVLFVVDNESLLTQRELATKGSLDIWGRGQKAAHMFITSRVADQILRHAGTSLEEVRQREAQLGPDDGFVIRTGVDARLAMQVSDHKMGKLNYVEAFVPGRDVGSRVQDTGMDREMVVLLANYDGLGRDVDGTLYPSANRNASGVAVMLETARVLQEAKYQPYRTLLYVAWAGEELRSPPSFWNMLRERTSWLERYRIAAVIELIGVGAGSGDSLLIRHSTSNRLTEALQEAAKRTGVGATTIGTDIHGVYGSLYPSPDLKVPTVSLTWEGSFVTAHTPQDTFDTIDPQKLGAAGRVASLAYMYLAHEKEY